METYSLRSAFPSSRKLGDCPQVCRCVLWVSCLGTVPGYVPGINSGTVPEMYTCFAMDLLAECREQKVASQARSTALGVRFIVADREIWKGFLCQIHHLPPLFLHNACSVPRRNDLC